MLSLEDALEQLAQKHCGQCAARLPAAGQRCSKCGAVPFVTRHELAAQLAEPGALAQAEAGELRAEAARLRDEAVAKFREADRVLHLSSLRSARDRAQDALEDAHGRLRDAHEAAGHAGTAEAAAAEPAREAYEQHRKAAQDEEAARRFGLGPAAEAEAADKLTVRATVLARYQGPLQAAMTAKLEAEQAAAAAAETVQAAEEARDQAVRAHEHPAHIPLSGETVTGLATPLTRFSMGADVDGTELTEVERMLASLPGVAMAEVSGVAADQRNKARLEGRKEAAEAEASRPRVVNANTVLAPGSVRTQNGGLYSPGGRI